MMHGYRFCPSHQRTKSWWFGVQWPLGGGMWSKIGEGDETFEDLEVGRRNLIRPSSWRCIIDGTLFSPLLCS